MARAVVYPCKNFTCIEDPRGCLECYNGACDGTGYEGQYRCGCNGCEYFIIENGKEGCSYND